MERLIDAGTIVYGIEEDSLYPYLHIRSLLAKGAMYYKTKEPFDIGKYLIEELKIIGNYTFTYDELESLKMRFNNRIYLDEGVSYDMFMIDLFNRIRKKSLKRANKFPKREVPTYYKYFALLELRDVFSAKIPQGVILIDGVSQDEALIHERMEEEKLESIIKTFTVSTTQFEYIREKDVEDFLIKNLDLIEEGLEYISRQVNLPEGRIDILARDKEGSIVVIEIKKEEDKDILWQSLYYPKEMRNKYEDVRMIVIAPNYSNSLYRMVKNISEAKLLKYIPVIKYGRIENIIVNEVNHN